VLRSPALSQQQQQQTERTGSGLMATAACTSWQESAWGMGRKPGSAHG